MSQFSPMQNVEINSIHFADTIWGIYLRKNVKHLVEGRPNTINTGQEA